MTRPLRFEPFDAEPVAPAPAGPSEDWLAGHAAGLAEATESDARRRALAEEAALTAFADVAFTWAEARAGVLASLGPFFEVLAARLVPEIAGEAFTLHLVETLARAAAEDIPTSPGLALSPSDARHLGPVLTATMPDIRLGADPGLADGQARILRDGRETVLDVPALVAALREILAAWSDDTGDDARLQKQGLMDHG
jgi:hypothetical protein